MNSIKCPKCGFENAFGLVFCTNCGESLYHSGARPTDYPTKIAETAEKTVALSQPKNGVNSKFLIFGGLGCFGLMFAGLITLGVLYYLEKKNDVAANSNVANVNSTVTVNANRPVVNAIVTNSNSDDPDDTDLNTFTFPPSVGLYEQQSLIRGNPAEDFPGADEVNKATYVKKGKEVEIIIAKFSDPKVSKSSFETFLQGFKSSGAKILARKKSKNKAGVVNGEVGFFTYQKKWNMMFYTEKQAGRYYAPDRYTMKEFTDELSKIYKTSE